MRHSPGPGLLPCSHSCAAKQHDWTGVICFGQTDYAPAHLLSFAAAAHLCSPLQTTRTDVRRRLCACS